MAASPPSPSRRAFLQGRLLRDARPRELHISSLLVQHRNEALAGLRDLVAGIPALEIAATGEGRCVVLCETDDQRGIMDAIDAMQALPGVVTVSLVYHHAEPLDQLDEEVSHGDHAA